MYRAIDITHIHFEPTQRCQALCPMCDRTNNTHMKNAELSLEQFKQIENYQPSGSFIYNDTTMKNLSQKLK